MTGAAAHHSVFASSAARVLRAIARIGTLVVVARLYPLAAVGEFAFVFGAATIGIGVLDLGLTAMLQREMGREGSGAHGLAIASLRIRLVTLVPGVAASALLAQTVAGGFLPGAAGTIAFAAAFSLADFLAAIRRAKGDFVGEATEMAVPVGAVGLSLATAWAMGLGFQAFQLVLGGSAFVLVGSRAAAMIIGPLAPRSAAGSGPSIGSLLERARWFWLMGVGSLLLFELPVVLLRWLATPEEVGLFAAAMRAVGLATQPFVIFAGVFVPALAWSSTRSPADYRRVADTLNVLQVVSFPAALGVAVLGGAILLRGFGGDFATADPLVWTLAIAYLIYLGAPSSGIPLVEGRERALAATSLLASVTLGVSAVILIPLHGALGTALATVFAAVAGKIGHALLYRPGQVRRIPPEAVPWVAVTLLWIVALMVAGGIVRLGVILAGSGFSAVRAWHLLRRTSLVFRASPRRSG